MDKLIESIAHGFLQAGLIDDDQTEWLVYSLQCRAMNIGGFCVLIFFGLLVAPFPQVLLLNLGLAFLRKRTNGLHMPTTLSCFAFSIVCEYACLYLIRLLSADLSIFSFGLLAIATVLICLLAPCNNKAIHLSQNELKKARKAVYIQLALYFLIMFGVFTFSPSFVNTLVVAETAVAVLVALDNFGIGIE